jgi:hypothetical protein
MAIEIKELHIRVAVNASESGQPSGGSTAGVRGGNAGGEDRDLTDAIVAECVEQVLEILQKKADR